MEAEPPLPNNQQSPEPAAVSEAEMGKQRYPVMTWIFCAICIGVFFGLQHEPNRYSWEALQTWGAYPAFKIRGGAIWGFITSAFVHLELWHLAFNVYWLYVLGTRLERAIGWGRYLAFFLAAAFLSSGAEFAFSDSTGIGASGAVYAIFGFMWPMRGRQPSFQKVLDSRTIFWFIAWLIGCIAMTLTKVWEVGNAAHVAGLLFGAGVAAWILRPELRRPLKLGFASLLLLSVIPIIFAPWSGDWTSHRGMRAYEKGDYFDAIKWFNRSLSLGQDKAWCLQSIALAYFAAGEQAQYQATLESLRKLDEKTAEHVEGMVKGTPASLQDKH